MKIFKPTRDYARVLAKLSDEEDSNGSTTLATQFMNVAREIEAGREISPEEFGEIIFDYYNQAITILLDDIEETKEGK